MLGLVCFVQCRQQHVCLLLSLACLWLLASLRCSGDKFKGGRRVGRQAIRSTSIKQRTGERVITQIAQSNYHNASTTARLPRCQKGLLEVPSSNLLSVAWLRDARLVVSAIVALSVCFSPPASCTASKPPTAQHLPHVCALSNTVFNLGARIRLAISFVLSKMRQAVCPIDTYRDQPHMLCHSNLNYYASSLIRVPVSVSDWSPRQRFVPVKNIVVF